MSEESSSQFMVPAGLLERVRNINQIYKQTVKLLPTQQGAVVNGFYTPSGQAPSIYFTRESTISNVA